MAVIRTNHQPVQIPSGQQRPHTVTFNVPQNIGNPTGNGLNTAQIIKEIQSASILTGLAYGERQLLKALFGTGIGKAISNEKISGANKENNRDSFITDRDDITPDAKPDGKGGFLATKNWGRYMSSSLIGMPVMCRLKFVGTFYKRFDGVIVEVPDIIFETVLITMRQTKCIKKTNITGRHNQGSVKENVSAGDWIIDIRAIITASAPVNNVVATDSPVFQDGIYPIENMLAIRELIEADIAIKVECWYLNKIAGVNYVVIDSGVDICQIEGEYEMQRITIPCISDNPLIVKVGV